MVWIYHWKTIEMIFKSVIWFRFIFLDFKLLEIDETAVLIKTRVDDLYKFDVSLQDSFFSQRLWLTCLLGWENFFEVIA